MSIELCGKMYSMDDAFKAGDALLEACGYIGRVNIRPTEGMLIVSIVAA